jgi:hypothetical protein
MATLAINNIIHWQWWASEMWLRGVDWMAPTGEIEVVGDKYVLIVKLS